MVETFDEEILSLTFTGDWALSTKSPHSGANCYKSATITGSGSSSTQINVTVPANGYGLSFWYRISSQVNHGKFSFYVDDVISFDGVSGINGWIQYGTILTAGEHVLKWTYTKDTSDAAGEDAVYIDDIGLMDIVPTTCIADTVREVYLPIQVSFIAETKRIICIESSISVDTKRNVNKSIAFSAETNRRLSSILTSSNALKSISIAMEAKTLSDTFSIETIKPMNIGDAVRGTLLGYDYQFLVEETSQSDDVQKITGMYDLDLLLCTPLTVTETDENSAKATTGKLAKALGLSASINIDDFNPSTNLATVGATYKNIVSSLFGWTSSLPQRQVNVFIRANTLYAIQRGKESSNVAIGEKHTRPQINRKIIRSMWAGTAGSKSISTSVVISPIPFSGSIQFGDQSASYANGLLVSEAHAGTITSYSYSNQYISHKSTISPKAKIETDYDYGGTGSGYTLAVETETTTTLDDSGSVSGTSVKVTRHVPIGNDWWGTSVEEDGVPTGSSISKGKPGGKASLYCIDASNRSLGSTYNDGNDDGTGLSGNSLIDTNFPVSDLTTLRKLTAAIEWLNGKIEEHVAMDVYEQEKIDFDKTITYAGNIYYLEKNTITQTPREIKQSIEIVRWY